MLCAAGSIVLLAGLGAWLWHDATARVRDDAATAAYAAARELSDDAPLVRAVGLAALFPTRTDVWSWTAHGESLSQTHAQFVRTAELHGEDAVRLIVPETESGYAVPGDRHAERFVATISSRPSPRWLEPVREKEGLMAAWETGKGHHLLDDASGRVITWSPVLDEHGHPVGVLELTRTVADPLFAARQEAGFVLAAVGALLAAVSVAVVGMARAQDAELAGGMAAIRRLRSGERGVAIRRGTALAGAVERLRQTLVEEAAEAARRAAELQARLGAAELLLDADTVARRKALGTRVGAHRILVRAGEVVAEEVELVDLTYGVVHVRVGAISALDLAVGMPLLVGWSCERPSLNPVWVRRRIETDAGVEYVLGGDEDMELTGTPSALRSSAYPPRAPRMSMLNSGATARLLRVGSEGESCTLMDLSAYGAQVLALQGSAAILEMGTRFALELVLPGEAAPVVVLACLRRVGELQAGTTLHLEFERTGAGAAGQRQVAAWLITQNSAALAPLSAA